LDSAFGWGLVAITSNPRARYNAVQLEPISPVPTIAIRRIGLLKLEEEQEEEYGEITTNQVF
jgi:hypothetical protein